MWWRSVGRVANPRKYLFYVLVSAIVFAAAPVYSQTADEAARAAAAAAAAAVKAAEAKAAADAFNAKIDALIKALAALAPKTEPKEKPKEDPVPQKEELAQLASAISKVLTSKLAATTWATDLTALLEGGKANLKNGRLRTALTSLTKLLPKPVRTRPVVTEDPASQPTGAKKLVQDFIKDLEGLKQAADALPAGFDEQKLAQLATAISKLLDPTFAVAVWAECLTVILGERKSPEEDAEVKAALEKLAEAIPPVDEKLGPYLNIVQAWFGDFYYIRRAARGQLRINPDTGTGFRVCEATNEVRHACQGKSSCPFKPSADNSVPVQPDLAKLCGEHPVPQASRDDIGVAIEFQCLHATRKTWNSLQNNWKIEDPDNYPSKMVMLRAATEVMIRCEAEIPEAGQN